MNRAKSVNDALDLENKQLGAQISIYEAKAIKARKEVKRAQVKLEEFMGTYEESEDEEGQSRRRPRTIGLKKALAKQREQESTLVEQLPLDELLAMEIAHDQEPWLERANIHFEAKLKKENQDLNLQRKMTKHYAQRNQVARAKLKKAQTKIKALK